VLGSPGGATNPTAIKDAIIAAPNADPCACESLRHTSIARNRITLGGQDNRKSESIRIRSELKRSAQVSLT